MPHASVKFSVAICCANNADTLEAACRSVAWADELVIVDSGSTDATPQIARQYADQYVVEPWRGFSEQKAYAASLCRNDWVLILDSDEEVSPDLARAIQALTEAELAALDVLHMRRFHYVMGLPVRAWRPDWQSRLIHRDRVRWTGHALHDDRLPGQPGRERRIRSGHLEHKRINAVGWPDYFCGTRLDARVLKVAQQMHDQGRRAHWWDLVLRPRVTWFKLYVLKAGFLDGTFGLLIAQKSAWGVQLKYAALWAVQNSVATPPPPEVFKATPEAPPEAPPEASPACPEVSPARSGVSSSPPEVAPEVAPKIPSV